LATIADDLNEQKAILSGRAVTKAQYHNNNHAGNPAYLGIRTMSYNSYNDGTSGYTTGRAPRESYTPRDRFEEDSFGRRYQHADSAGILRKSLFTNSGDMRIAQRTLEDVLRGVFDGKGCSPNENGMYSMLEAIAVIQKESLDMQYVGRNHLVEIFLRDISGSFVLDGDLIGHVRHTYIAPPKVLYFGTTGEISHSVLRHGIMSGSRLMATLHADIEDARKVAERYASRKGDEAVVLEVDSKTAYESNTDFSYSGVKGEYLVERIGYRYITALHHADGSVEEFERA
jgi:RNA:NAD 2'-phosphotransferase (TPT1/KptA family)